MQGVEAGGMGMPSQQASMATGYGTPAAANIITTDLIQKYLDENKQLILAILDNQNLGKLNECQQYQQRLQQNLMYLAAIADAQPQIPPAQQAVASPAIQPQQVQYVQQPQVVQQQGQPQQAMGMQQAPQGMMAQQHQEHQYQQHHQQHQEHQQQPPLQPQHEPQQHQQHQQHEHPMQYSSGGAPQEYPQGMPGQVVVQQAPMIQQHMIEQQQHMHHHQGHIPDGNAPQMVREPGAVSMAGGQYSVGPAEGQHQGMGGEGGYMQAQQEQQQYEMQHYQQQGHQVQPEMVP